MSRAGTQRTRLQVRGLECERGDRLIFQGLGFSVAEGQMLQVHGANGSGKTSLLRILCGLAPPAEGEVLWDGAHIHDQRHDYLRQMGYIGHAGGIKPGLSVIENLRVALALGNARAAADIPAALAHFGLQGMEDEPARNLSAGQRRRVGLARLLLEDCPLWILDEPFTSLDRQGKTTVERLLVAHCDAGGMTVFTTHQPLELHHGNMKELHLGTRQAMVA